MSKSPSKLLSEQESVSYKGNFLVAEIEKHGNKAEKNNHAEIQPSQGRESNMNQNNDLRAPAVEYITNTTELKSAVSKMAEIILFKAAARELPVDHTIIIADQDCPHPPTSHDQFITINVSQDTYPNEDIRQLIHTPPDDASKTNQEMTKNDIIDDDESASGGDTSPEASQYASSETESLLDEPEHEPDDEDVHGLEESGAEGHGKNFYVEDDIISSLTSPGGGPPGLFEAYQRLLAEKALLTSLVGQQAPTSIGASAGPPRSTADVITPVLIIAAVDSSLPISAKAEDGGNAHADVVPGSEVAAADQGPDTAEAAILDLMAALESSHQVPAEEGAEDIVPEFAAAEADQAIDTAEAAILDLMAALETTREVPAEEDADDVIDAFHQAFGHAPAAVAAQMRLLVPLPQHASVHDWLRYAPRRSQASNRGKVPAPRQC
jgi:hypothetical protein